MNFEFSPPIFQWQEVPGRFFEMVHSALGPELIDKNLRNFIVEPANSLGDAVAKFFIFGGPSSVTLAADKLSVELPTIFQNDTELVVKIVEGMYSGFHDKFSECRCSRVRITMYDHAEVTDGNSPTDYLGRFSVPLQSPALNDINVKVQPNPGVSIISEDESWNAACTVESSEVATNALFINLVISLNVSEIEPFHSLLERYKRAGKTCLSILELRYL